MIASTYKLSHAYGLALVLFALHFAVSEPLLKCLLMGVVALGLSEVARSAKASGADKRTVDYLWVWAVSAFVYMGWLASQF